jgi:GT2 family glycosyltransferase
VGFTSIEVTIRLQSLEPIEVMIDGGSGAKTETVMPEGSDVTITVKGEPYDVINNVGSIVYENGAGADRGWLERDWGQYDQPVDVFAWCGGAVLLRPEYLEDVGLFDERFFLYYEDTDLSWRGQARGWRYRTAPKAVVRHVHSASSGVGSAVFEHYVERNRLLLLVKNAPMPLAIREMARFARSTASYGLRRVVIPLLHGRRPETKLVRRRVKSFMSFVRLLPTMLLTRRSLRRETLVDDVELAKWFVER